MNFIRSMIGMIFLKVVNNIIDKVFKIGHNRMNIIFNQTISMLECVSIAKKHIENNIAKNSSGTVDINNIAKLLNRIAEYSVLIFVNRNYYKQFIISCDDEIMHYGKPLNTVIKQGLGLGEIGQSVHAEHLKHARKLIQSLGA